MRRGGAGQGGSLECTGDDVLAIARSVARLAVVEAYRYWTDGIGDAVMKVSSSGGSPEALAAEVGAADDKKVRGEPERLADLVASLRRSRRCAQCDEPP